MPKPKLQPFGIRVSTWTGANQIIDILNRPQPSEKDCEAARARFGDRLAPIPSEEFRPFFRGYLAKQLRAYVDPWLDSGRKPDGSEDPASRTVTPELLIGVLGFLETHRPAVQASKDPWGFSVVLDPFTDHNIVKETVFSAVENNATRLFCALIASEWRAEVCKCRYHRCGRYFLLPKPRSYKNGTFCRGSHRGSASAHDLRSRASATLIDWAAGWLHEHSAPSGWNDDADWKKRLRNGVSSKLHKSRLNGGPEDVSLKWVTQNAHKIELRRKQLIRRG